MVVILLQVLSSSGDETNAPCKKVSPGIPVIVGKRPQAKAGGWQKSFFKPDIILLDDGMQILAAL